MDFTSSFVWSELDSEQRVEVWLAHMDESGTDIPYHWFANGMDLISTTA